jgi:hypothetical protein
MYLGIRGLRGNNYVYKKSILVYVLITVSVPYTLGTNNIEY